MHISTRSPVRGAAAAALLAAAVALVGCGPSAPTVPTATDATPSPTATSVPPSPTASATPTPTPTPTSTSTPTPTAAPSETAGQVFETQNGTMRLPLPDGWTVDDQSRLGTDLSGRPQWENSIGFRSPGGTELQYYDGFGALAGFHRTEFGVVEQRTTDIGHGIAAMSWWVHDGRYFVQIGRAHV